MIDRKLFILLILMSILLSGCHTQSDFFQFSFQHTATATSSATVTASATLTSTATSTATFTPTITYTPTITPTPTKTPLPEIPTPPPATGDRGNVYGRILYGDKPAQGIVVSLYAFIGPAGDSIWHEYKDMTDHSGIYEFRNVAVHDGYTFDVEIDENISSYKDYIPSLNKPRVAVESGMNTALGDFYLVRNDLEILSPQYEAVIAEDKPTLEWSAYPGASYYEVTLRQHSGNLTNDFFQTTDTSLQMPLPLMACRYYWDVVAYNDEGKPLAVPRQLWDGRFDAESFSNTDGYFQIINEYLPSCYVKILSPTMFQELRFNQVGIVWEEHPLAEKYEITVRVQRPQKFNDMWMCNTAEQYSYEIVVDENGDYEQPILPYIAPTKNSHGSCSVVVNIKSIAFDGSIAAESSVFFTIIQ